MDSLKNSFNGIKYLNNVKSQFILRKIFENLKLNKKLKIIKYNKSIQKRCGIGINDYIDSQKIIIEIIPLLNKYGQFIYKIKEDKKQYYHIYFNNNEKEIDRNYISESDNVEKIKLIIDYEIDSLMNLFYDSKFKK